MPPNGASGSTVSLAILFGLAFLAILFGTIISKGYTAFVQSSFKLNVNLDRAVIDPRARATQAPSRPRTTRCSRRALATALGIDPADKPQMKEVGALLSKDVDVTIRKIVLADPSLIGKTVPIWVLASGRLDSASKGPDRPQAAGGDTQAHRPAGRVDRQGNGGRLPGRELQHRPLHLRRLEPPGDGGHRRRAHRLVVHDAHRAAAGGADRRRGRHLSGRVRAEEPPDRPDRGQHQQPRRGAVDRLRPARPRHLHQLRSACRARHRWSAAWCWR